LDFFHPSFYFGIRNENVGIRIRDKTSRIRNTALVRFLNFPCNKGSHNASDIYFFTLQFRCPNKNRPLTWKQDCFNDLPTQVIVKEQCCELTMLDDHQSTNLPAFTEPDPLAATGTTVVISMAPTLTTSAELSGAGTGTPVGNYEADLRHEARTSRRKIFVCPHEGCDKAYAVKNYLVEHERLHTGGIRQTHFVNLTV
jgi:hypothetical protein